jgi:hypothetical protein
MGTTREPLDLQQLRVQLARAVRLEGPTADTTQALRRQYEVARTAHVISDRLAGMGPLTASEIATLTALIEAAADAVPVGQGSAGDRQEDPDGEPLFVLDETGGLIVVPTPQNGADSTDPTPARRRRAKRQGNPDSEIDPTAGA